MQLLRADRRDPVLALGGVADPGLADPAAAGVDRQPRAPPPPTSRRPSCPGSIIAMQNAPAAPDPTGLGAALTLLGQSGAFKDITGLEGNQKNAAAALQQSLQTATTFGTKAADLALQGKMSKDIDKAMKTIVAAREAKLIDDKQATELMGTAIRGMVGAGATNPKEASTTADVEKITKTAGRRRRRSRSPGPPGRRSRSTPARAARPRRTPRSRSSSWRPPPTRLTCGPSGPARTTSRW